MYKTTGRVAGGCFTFFLVWGIATVLGGLTKQSYFAPIWLALTAAGAFLGGKLLHTVERVLKPELDIDLKLMERRKVAEKRGIRESAALVVNVLGRNGQFHDGTIRIRFDRQGLVTTSEISYSQGGAWLVVFEGERKRGTSEVQERTLLQPLESGGYEVRKEYDNSSASDSVTISGYIPGEWETRLKDLRLKAERVDSIRKAQEQRAVARKLLEKREEERKKLAFNLWYALRNEVGNLEGEGPP